MQSLVENLCNQTKHKVNIRTYEDFREMQIPHLHNLCFIINDNCIMCTNVDIDNKENFLNLINLEFIGKKINTIKCIDDIFNKVLDSFKDDNISFIFNENNDPLYLFDKKKTPTKNNINRSNILEKSKDILRPTHIQIPKGLQLNHKQVFEMIYSEVEKVNKNMNYQHYIDFKDNDPYTLLFRFRYEKGELSDKLKKLKSQFDIDYIEVIIKLDNTLYPFLAPTIEYSKPNMENEVIHNLKNISVLEQNNWNNNISLEWLITEIGNKFEPHFNKYIDINNYSLSLSKMDKIIFEILTIMGVNEYTDFNIKFDLPKFDIKEKSQYWGSGTGYGYEGKTTWDIENYLSQQNNKKSDIIRYLQMIIDWYPTYYNKEKVNEIMTKFISNQLRGTTILDFNNNKKLYIRYLEVIKELKLPINYDVISELYQQVEEIINNKVLYNDIEENSDGCMYTKDFCVIIKKLFESYKKIDTVTNISENEKDCYETMVKNNQFGTYEFDNKHLYYKFKDEKITNKKNLLRLVSEISSLKKNLPINWDTSSLLRVDKKQTNMIKFVITGPKDTPYHNGIYEFHAYFPSTYPNDPPHVLLNTTDGGKVRFNPNLYANGKVCLSLLGTWSGQQGEKWNGNISTFLQVIISIQSLIMVEDPYFNEPGYEKSMHTISGKKTAFSYKDKIRKENLRVSILNQLKNPPHGFEEFTINHFKAKKDEIIKMAEMWTSESINNNTNYNIETVDVFINNFKELISKN
jgi:ubiquitin-protein ligase